MEDKYWVIGSNRWSKSIYTKEEAETYAKTLINCENCTDCKFCRDCVNSVRLYYCDYCINCYFCRFSENLLNCSDVYFSYNLADAKKVERGRNPDFRGAE